MKATDMQSTLPLSVENPSTERCQWRTVPLRDIIFHPDYGVTASATIDPVGPKFLRITDIGKPTIDWDRVPHCRCSDREKEEKRLRNGDLVVARIGATTGITYLYRSYDAPAVFASYLIRIRCSETLSPEFLNQFSQSPLYWNQVDAIKQGRLKEGINTEELKSLMIPLPPLPEQQRIATVLATVDEAIAATDEILAKTEDLKRGLMQDLLTKGIDEGGRIRSEETHAFCEKGGMWVPAEWDIGNLGEHSLKPDYGFTTSAVKERVGPKFIRITDIQDEKVDWSTVPYCHCSEKEKKKYFLEKGDLLIARIGATTGKTYLFSGDEDTVFASYLIRIKAQEGLFPSYLSQFTQSKLYWKQINAIKFGKLKEGINSPELQSIIMPLPPLPEQRRIAAILATVDDRLATERTERDRLVTLKKGLMQVLLTGRVCVPPGVAEEVAPAHV